MSCDVVVIGGGISGVFAALASARLSANTVLIEQHGFVGGQGTAGGVHYQQNVSPNCGTRANHLAASGSELPHPIALDMPRSPGTAGNQSVTQSVAPPCDLSGLKSKPEFL